MKIVVIGGGAAGFFAAINIAQKVSGAQVSILEKSNKLLQKVRVSGGGRCNVTNARSLPSQLIHFYPRGHKKLHQVFKTFTSSDMVDWLQSNGVETKKEEDLRMFPVTNNSKTIIDCFLALAEKHKVKILTGQSVTNIKKNSKWIITTKKEVFEADKVIVATGSSTSSWEVLQDLGLNTTNVVPSLFTFNIDDIRIKDLQGISFKEATVKIAGHKLEESGGLLITHWGLSGPVILKLSSWGAYSLNELKYDFEILINYTGNHTDLVRSNFISYKEANPKRKVFNYPLFNLPKRFWESIVEYCKIGSQTTFGELSKKEVNKLIEELTQGRYKVNGKSTFKEEFVTAGGIKLSEVDLKTFEAKRFPGLYLAGEVLDIDALTGGFNFQACWSGGWIISESVLHSGD